MSAPPHNVAAVIVTFHPDDGFPTRLATIARQARHVIVVDNTAEQSCAERLRQICAVWGARLIVNDRNVGIATALNQGFSAAASQPVEWVCSFDQDSVPCTGFIGELLACAGRLDSRGERLGAIGANWTDRGAGGRVSRHLLAQPRANLFFQRVPAESDLVPVTFVISSGCLTRLAAWREVEGFDDGLFIDMVDVDFCLRLQRAAWQVAVCAAARLEHHRGAKRPVRWAGRMWLPSFTPAARLFFLQRNRVRLLARHGRYWPHWVGYELSHAAWTLFSLTLLEDQRRAKLRAFCRGTLAGLSGDETRWRQTPSARKRPGP